ncbi:MFS transporter [Haloglomus salinum]|uniref:MFS transporter n=1 Tax=Haloglomus salinum TaxID=2962673 RepID=UPI0020C948BE|nr:MFS transporter [Haloglomus salinum]
MSTDTADGTDAPATEPTGGAHDTARGWGPVAAIAGWQTAASACYYSLFAATGLLKPAFDLSGATVGLFLTVGLLGYTLALFPTGALVDGFGERRVMLAGLAGLAVAAVGVSLAPTYGALLAAAALLGAAYSTAMPATNRAIGASAPPGRANLAMGLKQVGVTAGSGLASGVFAAVAATTLVTWVAGFRAVAALGVLAAAGFALVYDGRPGSGRLATPDLRGLGDNRSYVLLVAAGFFLGAAIFAALGYVILYVDEGVGATVALGGLVLGATQVTGSVGRVLAGDLADRLGGAYGAATVTLGQAAAAFVLFGVLAAGVESVLVAGAVLLGIGISVLGSTGVFYSCLAGLVDDEDIGAATAAGQTSINAGGMVAPPAFGFLADTAGYGTAWLLPTACMLAAVVLLAGVRRTA